MGVNDDVLGVNRFHTEFSIQPTHIKYNKRNINTHTHMKYEIHHKAPNYTHTGFTPFNITGVPIIIDKNERHV